MALRKTKSGGARHKSSRNGSYGSAGVLAGGVNNKRAPVARFKCSGAIYCAPFIYYTTGEDAGAPMAGTFLVGTKQWEIKRNA